MMKDNKTIFKILLFLLGPCLVQAQAKYNTPLYTNYISLYKDIAVREMDMFHIPASICLAQGLLESGCGMSELAVNANNHFGIKCHKEWTGPTYVMDDDDKKECFRVYENPEQSYIDHSQFLITRDRYAGLFKFDITDYKSWAKGLKDAGYATNPEYANILIRIIEANELNNLDRGEDLPIANLPANDSITGSLSSINYEQLASGSHYQPGYRQPSESKFNFIKTGKQGHKVYVNNGINLTYARTGDTFSSIAKEFDIFSFQIYHYNDLHKNDVLIQGQIVYLEPKKRQSSTKMYTVRKFDNLYAISQLYGVRLKFMIKYNNMRENQLLKPGEKIRLCPG
ncbi:MAG TPA: glucosaminidase domain-containing protein [Bacteroidales bacterium]